MKQGAVCMLAVFSLFMPSLAVELSDALDAPSLVWETGGDELWFGQAETAYDGQDAAQSGNALETGESWLQTTVTGPTTVSFWWLYQADGMDGGFQVYVDGVERAAAATFDSERAVLVGFGEFAVTAGTSDCFHVGLTLR